MSYYVGYFDEVIGRGWLSWRGFFRYFIQDKICGNNFIFDKLIMFIYEVIFDCFII